MTTYEVTEDGMVRETSEVCCPLAEMGMIIGDKGDPHPIFRTYALTGYVFGYDPARQTWGEWFRSWFDGTPNRWSLVREYQHDPYRSPAKKAPDQ